MTKRKRTLFAILCLFYSLSYKLNWF